MNIFVDHYGRWIYPHDVEEGLLGLARSQKPCPILDLRGIPLSKPPTMLPKIVGLTDLYLGDNGLKSLPQNIGAVEHLRLISLGRNQISEIPISIKDRWHTLQIVYLGDNCFTKNPIDEEWMMMFKQGSIGNNPIPEPISPFWMTTQDALEFPERIQMLFPDDSSDDVSAIFFPLALDIIQNCPEPILYEVLFNGVQVLEDGTILWNEYFHTAILQKLGLEILAHLPRGSFVHPSLENTFLFNNTPLGNPLCS